jgi:hypothetical protein
VMREESCFDGTMSSLLFCAWLGSLSTAVLYHFGCRLSNFDKLRPERFFLNLKKICTLESITSRIIDQYTNPCLIIINCATCAVLFIM